MSPLLAVENLSCSYQQDGHTTAVIGGLNFTLTDGEIGCLLGPSGCGKTTALRTIAGFHKADAGSITLAGTTLCTATQHLPPEKRKVGMVFQDYALFPHLSVCQNITFGLKKCSISERERMCDELLALVKLSDLGHRYPHELSGGQQQRVALARALAPSPRLLLLDEPFSSLDTELRRALALEVREILKARNIAAIMVTHDQAEAFAFADNVGVLHQGALQQWAPPYQLYHEPATRFVADFIGHGVFVPGTVSGAHHIETELGELASRQAFNWPAQTRVEVLLRPDDIIYTPEGSLTGVITHKVFVGTSTLYSLQLPTGSTIEAALPSHLNFELGASIPIAVKADHLIAFERAEAKQAPNTASALSI